MENDCLEHDVNSPSSTKNINRTDGLQHCTWKCPVFLLAFVDYVEHEYPEKEKTIYERAVTWWHIFCSALRSAMLQRVWKSSRVSKTASKQVVKKTGVQKPTKTTRTKRGVTWFAVSMEEGPLRSYVSQSFPIIFLLFLFPVFGRTDLGSENCIKFWHVQTAFLLKIRFVAVFFFCL